MVIDARSKHAGKGRLQVPAAVTINTHLQLSPMQSVGPQCNAGFHEVCIINALYAHVSPLKLLKDLILLSALKLLKTV